MSRGLTHASRIDRTVRPVFCRTHFRCGCSADCRSAQCDRDHSLPRHARRTSRMRLCRFGCRRPCIGHGVPDAAIGLVHFPTPYSLSGNKLMVGIGSVRICRPGPI
ncbi:hypothetical protein BURCENBC7_AP4063 [Burkholderia cenocepacia BC7]|nr:hypothetical protein BURCENK562V_C5333 [Burkholderia cenocepacia K56-2Valvano]ERI29468.1 hypothetical protein BURCENBC7_AP4063 [Burkholderia cenocepacia BC7]